MIVSSLGLAGAACVRPHIAVIWLAAVCGGTAITTLARRGQGSTLRLVATVVLAAFASLFVGRAAIEYLDPAGQDEAGLTVTDRINDILDTTQGRTTLGGSGFTPPSLSSPATGPSPSSER